MALRSYPRKQQKILLRLIIKIKLYLTRLIGRLILFAMKQKSFKNSSLIYLRKWRIRQNCLTIKIPVIQRDIFFRRTDAKKNIAHIDDIDLMWDDISENPKESLDAISSRLQNIDTDILNMQKHIDEIDTFISILNGYIAFCKMSMRCKESLAVAHNSFKKYRQYYRSAAEWCS